MAHPFDKHFKRRSYYPRIRLRSGAQKLTVEFHPGYLRIITSPPYSGEVYITRSAAFEMLKQMVPLMRYWAKHPAKDFDVPQRVHEAYMLELALDRERREQKKARYQSIDEAEAREKKRRRWLKARARARNNTT